MAKRKGPLERVIEKHLIRKVKEAGGFTRKYVSPGHRGVPDRIIFLNGVYFVEVKNDAGVLSALQAQEMNRMMHQGAIVVLLASCKDVDKFVATIASRSNS